MDPVLVARGVSFSYPEPQSVLSGFDLELAAGETLGIVGPNGAGKTTLFLLIAGVLGVEEGSLEVLGRSAGDPELRGRVALVPQNVDDQLFSTTVFDDVAFGPLNLGVARADVAARVAEALRAVGLEGFEDRVPHHLSGGEKRKVALAAVLSMEPDLFLLDEPTSDLDPLSRVELVGLLRQIPRSKVIASHDFELLTEVADRVVVLHRGRVVLEGPPLDVLSNEASMTENGLAVPSGLRALRELRAARGEADQSGASSG